MRRWIGGNAQDDNHVKVQAIRRHKGVSGLLVAPAVYLFNQCRQIAIARLRNVFQRLEPLLRLIFVAHEMLDVRRQAQRVNIVRIDAQNAVQRRQRLIVFGVGQIHLRLETKSIQVHGLNFDVIVVLGVSPTATGGLSASGVLRLKEAVKGAYYCPDAKIIISGGAIDYDFSEAETMKDYLLKHSTELAIALGLEPEGSAWCIPEERILLDTEARDTGPCRPHIDVLIFVCSGLHVSAARRVDFNRIALPVSEGIENGLASKG